MSLLLMFLAHSDWDKKCDLCAPVTLTALIINTSRCQQRLLVYKDRFASFIAVIYSVYLGHMFV